jgi:hypothetical protein
VTPNTFKKEGQVVVLQPYAIIVAPVKDSNVPTVSASDTTQVNNSMGI